MTGITLSHRMCRSENATLKKLRRQQEQALAEVVSQKEEVLRWAAEEKVRTAKWCEEQQQLAVRERNAAAKIVSFLLCLWYIQYSI